MESASSISFGAFWLGVFWAFAGQTGSKLNPENKTPDYRVVAVVLVFMFMIVKAYPPASKIAPTPCTFQIYPVSIRPSTTEMTTYSYFLTKSPQLMG